MKYRLVCSQCGNEADESLFRGRNMLCPACGGILEVQYAGSGAYRIEGNRSAFRAEGVWHYRDLLPDSRAMVTLGEGHTPLVSCGRLSGELGIAELTVKNEGLNPSGTYKDRGVAVSISKAIDLGFDTVILGSAGNAGSSAAAYAAHAGLKCVLLLPSGAVKERVRLSMLYGARVIVVNGTIDDCIMMAQQLEREYGWYGISTARQFNPYCVEGYKTIAYELCEQYGFRLPEWVAAPIGGGSLLSEIWRGFTEMREMGMIGRVPRLLGVQADGCRPYVEHFLTGEPVKKWEAPYTIAFAIADVWPYDAAWVDKALEGSEGFAVSVSDAEIRVAQQQLVRGHAILAEPSSATAVAAVAKCRRSGLIQSDERVCCVISGNGIKDLAEMCAGIEIPVPVSNDIKSVKSLITA
jgi:threonine synthase